MKSELRYLELTSEEWSVLFRAIDGSIDRYQELIDNPHDDRSVFESCPDWLTPIFALEILETLRAKMEDLL